MGNVGGISVLLLDKPGSRRAAVCREGWGKLGNSADQEDSDLGKREGRISQPQKFP